MLRGYTKKRSQATIIKGIPLCAGGLALERGGNSFLMRTWRLAVSHSADCRAPPDARSWEEIISVFAAAVFPGGIIFLHRFPLLILKEIKDCSLVQILSGQTTSVNKKWPNSWLLSYHPYSEKWPNSWQGSFTRRF